MKIILDSKTQNKFYKTKHEIELNLKYKLKINSTKLKINIGNTKKTLRTRPKKTCNQNSTLAIKRLSKSTYYQ